MRPTTARAFARRVVDAMNDHARARVRRAPADRKPVRLTSADLTNEVLAAALGYRDVDRASDHALAHEYGVPYTLKSTLKY
jgi:hypothetical protein